MALIILLVVFVPLSFPYLTLPFLGNFCQCSIICISVSKSNDSPAKLMILKPEAGRTSS